MNTPNDGGPAFPGANPAYDGNWDKRITQGGMTLRDYFAGQALAGWLSGPCSGDVLDDYEHETDAFRQHQASVAYSCYGYADAMLEAREAKQ